MKILLPTCVLLALAETAFSNNVPQEHSIKSTAVYANPAVTYVGKQNGNLEKCNRESSVSCETFYQADSPIYSLLISSEYIYAGLNSGVILRCLLNIKDSCEHFYSGNKEVRSLVNTRGHLYAGLSDGTILRCELQEPNCQPLHNLTYSVNALIHIGNSIFAGLSSGNVIRCSLVANNCRIDYETGSSISGIANINDSTYLLTNPGELWKCSRNGGSLTKCIKEDSKKNRRNLKSFNESLYIYSYGNDTGICKWVDKDTCESYINVSSLLSMAFAYGTYNLQDQYKKEHECKQESDVCEHTYYNEKERIAFEVHVENGKLRYNSNYSLVHTRNADQGHDGPAAIFVMGPDGKIYLSNHHQGGVDTSSFLAGAPVSGAGEMVVQYGVIKKILACSRHYMPDLELNKQVIQSLRTQRYTNPISLEECH